MKKETREAAMKLLLAVNTECHEGKGDAAFIMMKDGSTIIGGVCGRPIDMMEALGRLIIKQPDIRNMLLMTVDAYRDAEAKVDGLKKEEQEADHD